MMIIGPIVALPRIVTLSHVMVAPFLPLESLQDITPFSSLIFAILFFGITFLATYRESKIVKLLGTVISPLLLGSLGIIISVGIAKATIPTTPITSSLRLFFRDLIIGYETLDLLSALFFTSIVIQMIRSQRKFDSESSLARFGFKSGLIGIALLALVYTGMGIIGMYHGHGMEHSNPGEMFRIVSERIVGHYGLCIIAIAVLMACLSTAIALAVVVAEYLQKTIFHNRISYLCALITTLVSSIPLSVYGLKYVLALAGGPITYIGYPALMVLTLCNLLHKQNIFHAVKLPVVITIILATTSYLLYS
jgi:LIVCS family branched-chain amino acid:cation transporter